MKRFHLAILVCAIALAIPQANAQYYDIANQIPSLLSPILSGSGRYKGYVDAQYLQGVGSNRADILGFSTSQGYQYNSWFYMGAGLGVDVLFAHQNDNWCSNWGNGNNSEIYPSHSSTATGVMIPLFSDFRLTVPSKKATSPSFFADLRLGASFLIGKNYIRINNGYLTNSEYFYLRPSVGVRIPVNKNRPRQAVDLGITYQLLTSNYWSGWTNSVTLNSLGITAAFEW